MSSFAYYRLPGQSQCICVKSNSAPYELSSYTQLDASMSGYILAPFHISSTYPLLVIAADFVQVCPIKPVLKPTISVVKQQVEDASYHEDFQRFHAALETGTLKKLVLARQLQVELSDSIDSVALFYHACTLYPHAFVSLVSTPQSGTWLMATPETLLAKRPVGDQWYTMALAGTMDHSGPWAEKNCLEQRLVADYIETCLQPHVVQLQRSMPYVRQAAQLYHRCTDFLFVLKPQVNLGNVIADLHPTPAVCGMPKALAQDFILREEHLHRAYYSGFTGPLNVWKTTHFFVSLRCMQLLDNRCILYAGGGLLTASNEQSEWNETELKLNTMLNVLQSGTY